MKLMKIVTQRMESYVEIVLIRAQKTDGGVVPPHDQHYLYETPHSSLLSRGRLQVTPGGSQKR